MKRSPREIHHPQLHAERVCATQRFWCGGPEHRRYEDPRSFLLRELSQLRLEQVDAGSRCKRDAQQRFVGVVEDEAKAVQQVVVAVEVRRKRRHFHRCILDETKAIQPAATLTSLKNADGIARSSSQMIRIGFSLSCET